MFVLCPTVLFIAVAPLRTRESGQGRESLTEQPPATMAGTPTPVPSQPRPGRTAAAGPGPPTASTSTGPKDVRLLHQVNKHFPLEGNPIKLAGFTLKDLLLHVNCWFHRSHFLRDNLLDWTTGGATIPAPPMRLLLGNRNLISVLFIQAAPVAEMGTSTVIAATTRLTAISARAHTPRPSARASPAKTNPPSDICC